MLTPVTPPADGDVAEVTDGVRWVRLPMPFEPASVNAYLLSDGDGWLLVDTGIDDEATAAAWDRLLEGPLRGDRVTGILVTHWHNDHLGMTGRLGRRLDAPLLIHPDEYARAERELALTDDERGRTERAFMLGHGADPVQLERWIADGLASYVRISDLPPEHIAIAGDGPLAFGDGPLEAVTVSGHSPASTTLHDRGRGFCLAADQLSGHMVPSIGVLSDEADADPLGAFLVTTDRLRALIDDETLVLPGHEELFLGARGTFARIVARHAAAMNRVLDAAAARAVTAGELVPVLTRAAPGPTWYGFVVARAIAYVHHLEQRGLVVRDGAVGSYAFRAVPGAHVDPDELVG